MRRLGDDLPADTTEYPGGGKDEYAELALSEADYQCEGCGCSALDVGLYVCAEASAGGSLGSQWSFSLSDAQVLCAGCGGVEGYYVGLPDDDDRLSKLSEREKTADHDEKNASTGESSDETETSQPWLDADNQVTDTDTRKSGEYSASKKRFPKALRTPEEAYREQGRLGPEEEIDTADEQEETIDTAPPHAYASGDSNDNSESPQQSAREPSQWWVMVAIGSAIVFAIVVLLIL